ncbi:MAG: hypothetical protein KDB03_22810 [Planctomycetales bacterium]|nr:hypothetical protein [Planctomycetales bacterium]
MLAADEFKIIQIFGQLGNSVTAHKQANVLESEKNTALLSEIYCRAMDSLYAVEWYKEYTKKLAEHIVEHEKKLSVFLQWSDVSKLIQRHLQLWYVQQLHLQTDICDQLKVELDAAMRRIICAPADESYVDDNIVASTYLNIIVPPPNSSDTEIVSVPDHRLLYRFKLSEDSRRWQLVYLLWRAGESGLSASYLRDSLFRNEALPDPKHQLWMTGKNMNAAFRKENAQLEIFRENRNAQHYLRRTDT